MRRALVLGSRGFLGRHLVRRLRDRAIGVAVGVRPGSGSPGDVEAEGPVVECDVSDPGSVAAALRDAAPTELYHLAVWTGDADLVAAMSVNLMATAHVLEAVVASGLPIKVLIPGSAAEYGALEPADFPVTESCPVNPLTLYGVGKAAQALLADRYRRVHGLAIYWVRPFNVTGPGEPPSTVSSHLARQVAAVEAGLQAPRVDVARLDTSRDFVDVRDVARALDLVVERGEPGVPYNICSGVETPIRTVVDLLHELSACHWDLPPTPGRPRPDDVPRQRGSYERLRRATGWTPSISLRESLQTLLDAWRKTFETSPGLAPTSRD